MVATGISKERMILRLLPNSVGKCCNPLVMSAMGKELVLDPTCCGLSIPDLIQHVFTDGKTN